MKYERLTKKVNGIWCVTYKYGDRVEHKTGREINRLAELEDDLESGKIVRLPCKVGDTVYWLIANKYIIECVVNLINISVGRKTHFSVWAKQKCEGVETDFSSDDLGEEWFLTREEAEAKLKEFQNK